MKIHPFIPEQKPPVDMVEATIYYRQLLLIFTTDISRNYLYAKISKNLLLAIQSRYRQLLETLVANGFSRIEKEHREMLLCKIAFTPLNTLYVPVEELAIALASL